MAKTDSKLPNDGVPTTEETASAAAPARPEYESWKKGMQTKYPELGDDDEALFKASREGYDAEHEKNKENEFNNGRIYGAIQKSPEVANFIGRLANGDDESPEEAFAEFGEDLVELLTGKINSETYNKRKSESEAARQASEDAEKAKQEAAGKAYVDACTELGVDPEETEKKLLEAFSGGSDTFIASKEFYTALIQSLTREDDLAAAAAQGRGMSMANARKRSMGGDGLPRSAAGAASAGADKDSFAAHMAARAQQIK